MLGVGTWEVVVVDLWLRVSHVIEFENMLVTVVNDLLGVSASQIPQSRNVKRKGHDSGDESGLS